MAPKPEAVKPTKRIPGIFEPADPNLTYIVGLKKHSPGRYLVVTGTVEHPIIDTTPDRLESAAEVVKRALHRLMETLP